MSINVKIDKHQLFCFAYICIRGRANQENDCGSITVGGRRPWVNAAPRHLISKHPLSHTQAYTHARHRKEFSEDTSQRGSPTARPQKKTCDTLTGRILLRLGCTARCKHIRANYSAFRVCRVVRPTMPGPSPCGPASTGNRGRAIARAGRELDWRPCGLTRCAKRSAPLPVLPFFATKPCLLHIRSSYGSVAGR